MSYISPIYIQTEAYNVIPLATWQAYRQATQQSVVASLEDQDTAHLKALYEHRISFT